MDVIGLNRQFQDCPTLFGALLLNKDLTFLGDGATQYRFAALGTPDQVVDDKVDAVFISLVIHVEIVAYFDIHFYIIVLQRRLKPGKAPNRYHSNGAACGGLKPISVNSLKGVSSRRLRVLHPRDCPAVLPGRVVVSKLFRSLMRGSTALDHSAVCGKSTTKPVSAARSVPYISALKRRGFTAPLVNITAGGSMDALVEQLDAKLRTWTPETAAQVRQHVAEIMALADQGMLDVIRSRTVEQEVLDLLDAPAPR